MGNRHLLQNMIVGTSYKPQFPRLASYLGDRHHNTCIFDLLTTINSSKLSHYLSTSETTQLNCDPDQGSDIALIGLSTYVLALSIYYASKAPTSQASCFTYSGSCYPSRTWLARKGIAP